MVKTVGKTLREAVRSEEFLVALKHLGGKEAVV